MFLSNGRHRPGATSFHGAAGFPFPVKACRRDGGHQLGERPLLAQAEFIGPDPFHHDGHVREVMRENNPRPPIRFPGANGYQYLAVELTTSR